jgi:hypothetical protein
LIEAAVQRFVVPADGVAEGERFSYWRDAVSEAMMGVSDERAHDELQPPSRISSRAASVRR